MADKKNHSSAILILNCLITAIIFFIDIVISKGFAAGPYVLTIIISLWLPGKWYTILFTVLSSILVIVGHLLFMISPEAVKLDSEQDIFVLNRMVALLAIWATTVLTLQRKGDRRRTEELLLKLSMADPLTEIYNRRYFTERLENEWRRLTRDKKYLGVIMIDVDYFKLYNDTLGHQAGDQCLREAAQVIKGEVHRADDFTARYGGEEFVALLPGTDPEGAVNVAKRIQAAVEQWKRPHPMSPISDYVTVSMGIAAMIPSYSCKADVLLGQADHALYQAKEMGRNRYVAYFDVQLEESETSEDVPVVKDVRR